MNDKLLVKWPLRSAAQLGREVSHLSPVMLSRRS